MVRNEGYIFTRGSTYIRSLYGLRTACVCALVFAQATDGMVWVDGFPKVEEYRNAIISCNFLISLIFS